MKLILNNWKFKACDDKEWLPATVPGCVHTDLLDNGIIADPFNGTNEQNVQWIDKKDWEYVALFDADEALLSHRHVELIFEGLDTYADVTLNGKAVLSADNMFRTWSVDVHNLLHPRNNQLHITFRSPIAEDLPKLEALGYALPAPNDQSEGGGLADKKVSIFARKAPYHYGWDWGPRFVTSGIWRETRLEAWSEVKITDLYMEQKEVTPQLAKLTAIIEMESDQAYSGLIKLSTKSLEWELNVDLTQGTNHINLDFEITNPDLWWSRGLGEPHLYEFKLEFTHVGNSLVERTVRTGLRTINLIRKKDEKGSSFYFELNGIPVFAKGANHIPNDSFASRVTKERYQHEIASAVMSNMNMLRVWGGGIYEQDVFYELCDEYGILVWQDFMFACSMYPGDEAFLHNVQIEAEENIKRLRNHPSIALWCGNNEMDSAWAHFDEHAGWGWKQNYNEQQREQIWSDYEAIFHQLLPEAVGKLHHNVAYWPSSPLQALTENKDQHSHALSSTGDIHYWGVWHAAEPFENYIAKVGRFMSEYGFQSFPEEKSVYTYAEPSDMELESAVMLCHQRNNDGNRLIKQYMDMYLPEPKDFSSFLYMSQILQAEAMKTAIEAHRRNKPYCMGSLYWQINDCWPVASWASMDYFGRWKAAQYYIKNSMRAIMVSIDGSSTENLDIHVVSDVLTPLDGKLVIESFDLGGQLLKTLEQHISVEPNSATLVNSVNKAEWIGTSDNQEVVLRATLEQGDQVLDRKMHFFTATQESKLQVAKITCRADDEAAGIYTLESDVLARGVWLSTQTEGIFSDNFFDLIPGQPVTVQFQARGKEGKPFSPSSAENLTVRSMADFIK